VISKYFGISLNLDRYINVSEKIRDMVGQLVGLGDVVGVSWNLRVWGSGLVTKSSRPLVKSFDKFHQKLRLSTN
jgi:hypothetical protein